MTEPKSYPKNLTKAADVTPEILTWAERVFEDWFDNDEPIDWERFWDRFADPNGLRSDGAEPFDIEDLNNPAISKIQRHVRAYKNQG